MRVVGTAGHVDHGKSTLVKALTGIDPDRLKEEQERHLTIDLGFAWLTLPSGEGVGVVDVPGHQDFIKNMLAGVGGIDAALFVIAADEGVMPQTQEHLAILDLLDIPAGVIVLTKVDAVADEEWLELVRLDVAETVAETVLADAPVVAVSALTGVGMDELRHTLDHTLAATPPRLNRGRPRLPVDRVFSVSGFGTIVTGTLLDGTLDVGQAVEVLPQGLKSRVRGLQSHKQTVNTAYPGTRTAVNLTNVSTDQLSRGSIITTPGWLEPSQLLDVHLRYLPDAQFPLKHNQSVELFIGTAEVPAYVRLLGQRTLEPGESGWVQLRLDQRIPVTKGDHFIIRQPSPSRTIGGGVVVDPLPRRRHRRFRPEVVARLETLLTGTPADLVLAALDRRGPLPAKTLIAEVRVADEVAAEALAELLAQDEVFLLLDSDPPPDWRQAKTLVVSRAGWANLLSAMKTTLAAYHDRYPLRLGMPRGELKSRLKLETRLFNEALSRAEQEAAIRATESTVRLAGHTLAFSPQQQTAIDALLDAFRRNPYSTPSYKEAVAQVGEEVFLALVESGQVLRISEDVLLLPETYAAFEWWLREYLPVHETINVAGVRDQFQTSRKYALALLEYTDAHKLTRRVGDDRILRIMT